MSAHIAVPAIGAGAILKILDAEHLAGYTPPDGYKLVEVKPPGVPINTIHWDGTAVASGGYVSDEEKAAVEARAAEQEAQELLNSRFAVFDYDLTTSLIARMSPDADLQAAVENATTVAELKAALTGVLAKITLTQAELDMMNGYREKYEAWIASKA